MRVISALVDTFSLFFHLDVIWWSFSILLFLLLFDSSKILMARSPSAKTICHQKITHQTSVLGPGFQLATTTVISESEERERERERERGKSTVVGIQQSNQIFTGLTFPLRSYPCVVWMYSNTLQFTLCIRHLVLWPIFYWPKDLSRSLCNYYQRYYTLGLLSSSPSSLLFVLWVSIALPLHLQPGTHLICSPPSDASCCKMFSMQSSDRSEGATCAFRATRRGRKKIVKKVTHGPLCQSLPRRMRRQSVEYAFIAIAQSIRIMDRGCRMKHPWSFLSASARSVHACKSCDY